MNRRIELATVRSTQAEVIQRIRAGEPADLTIVAGSQEGGIGRLDHRWASPPGGLYLSTVIPEPAFEPGLLPVALGAGLSRAFRDRFDLEARVRWPNDLLLPRPGGRMGKVAGILVDRLADPGHPAMLVIGLGVNAATDRREFSPELSERIAILSEACGRPVPPSEVEPIVLAVVRSAADRLATAAGARAVWAECRPLLFGVGRRIRVDGSPAGVIRDLAPDGALLVDRDGAIETVRAGEIVVEETA